MLSKNDNFKVTGLYGAAFISGTVEYNTFESPVPAPYIRKHFIADRNTVGTVRIAACGFYELYINGTRYTKGFLAPYVSNPEHYIYYDEYQVEIEQGENVIGILLGNGFQNNPGGYVWEFDKAPFRSAPMVAISLVYQDSHGNNMLIRSDKSFKTAPSPIRSDDYRFGECYDAGYEIAGWNEKGFDDSLWNDVVVTKAPAGELKLCEASPITTEMELQPVEIIKSREGYIYDFGISHSGVCRLCITGRKGQKITLRHADSLKDGDLCMENVWFSEGERRKDLPNVHKDTYLCKGEGKESYMPTFTYHGFRYVRVDGIDKTQATKDLLTFVVFHSDLESRGGFTCSDSTVNALQEMTRRSDLSNFHYFPTDCPHREKNGWTGDIALSSEQMLLNFAPERDYKEWMYNVRKAQADSGVLPGIIPTAGWGYEQGYGYGPGWDCVLAYVPYYTYIYRGEAGMIQENADAFMKQLQYLLSRKDANGLISLGLGDFLHAGRDLPKAPLEVTGTILAMDIARKIAFMFGVIGTEIEQKFARGVAEDFRTSIREHLVDLDTMLVKGDCQTSQAMGLYYGVFDENELQKAYTHLVELIHKEDDHMDVGVLGGRVLFHVLTDFGDGDLALKMITRPDFPSYGNWVARGATTLWEEFALNRFHSMNHHFWGDISSWFIKGILGIRLNPTGRDVSQVEIKPAFLTELSFAEGYHITPYGKVVSEWKKTDNQVILTVEIPESMSATVVLEAGFSFTDGTQIKEVQSGTYEIIHNGGNEPWI